MKVPAKKKLPRVHKELETLRLYLRSLGVEFVEEHRFHPVRKWRFDLAVPAAMVAIEYQGHGSTGGGGHVGRHASVIGMSGDSEKVNTAQIFGWRVLTFTALHFDSIKRSKHKLSSPLETIKAILQS